MSEKTNYLVFGAIGVLLLVAAGYYFTSQGKQINDSASDAMLTDESKTNDAQILDSDQMEESTRTGDISEEMETEVTQSGSAEYLTYSPEAVQAAVNEGKIPVIFFHADWCPTCKALDRELNDSQKISMLPENVVILKTDYDSQTELRRKHEVTIQHTLVQVDGEGNQVAKWSGGGVETIKDNLLL